MSNKRSAQRLELLSNLLQTSISHAAARLLAFVFLVRFNDADWPSYQFWDSNDELGEILHCSPRQVRRYIAELRSLGPPEARVFTIEEVDNRMLQMRTARGQGNAMDNTRLVTMHWENAVSFAAQPIIEQGGSMDGGDRHSEADGQSSMDKDDRGSRTALSANYGHSCPPNPLIESVNLEPANDRHPNLVPISRPQAAGREELTVEELFLELQSEAEVWNEEVV
jgi:hypothetical protein